MTVPCRATAKVAGVDITSSPVDFLFCEIDILQKYPKTLHFTLIYKREKPFSEAGASKYLAFLLAAYFRRIRQTL